PFYANYGYHPDACQNPKDKFPIAEQAHIAVKDLKKLHKYLQQEIEKISKKSAETANKKRTEGPDLKEGDMVYLLRKNIKTKRPSNKLDHTKIGPYKIRKKKGPTTFELDLLKIIRIYSIFYISILELVYKDSRLELVKLDEET